MLQQLESAKQKWGGKSEAVDNWLKARQQLLIEYCSLAGITSAEAAESAVDAHLVSANGERALPDAGDVETFCEDLMDYLSAGHFEVYDILATSSTRAKALKEQLYPRITSTTDAALRFNDRYTQLVQPEQASTFDKDLAELGEILEERFELEDRLLHHLHETATASD